MSFVFLFALKSHTLRDFVLPDLCLIYTSAFSGLKLYKENGDKYHVWDKTRLGPIKSDGIGI